PISNIVSSEGDWLFDAPAALDYLKAVAWAPVPEGERATRAELIALADAYLDRLADSSVTVPWAETCTRLDGGTVVAQCDASLPDGLVTAERQHVVDEVLGAVNVQLRLGDKRRAG